MKKLKILKVLKGFLKRRGGLVLTIISIAGVVVSTILSAKAGRKADENVRQAKEDKAMAKAAKTGEEVTEEMVENTELNWKEEFKAKGKAYAWTAVALVVTIGSILTNQYVTATQITNGLAAVSLANEGRKAYEEKTGKKFGKEAARDIKDEVNKERAESSMRSRPTKPLRRGGEDGGQWYFSAITDDWFYATPKDIQDAEEHICKEINSGSYDHYEDYYADGINGIQIAKISAYDIYSELNGYLHGNGITNKSCYEAIKYTIRYNPSREVKSIFRIESDTDPYGFVYAILDMEDGYDQN